MIEVTLFEGMEAEQFFVERIGKYGSMGAVYDTYEEAMAKAKALEEEENVIKVIVWN